MKKPLCIVVGVGPRNGSAISRLFASKGYSLAMLSRSGTHTSRLAEELEDAHDYRCDVEDPVAVQDTFSKILERQGYADVLIYNAGAGIWGTIEQRSAADFEKCWRTQAYGAFLVSQQVVPQMKERGSGAMIFVGATASLRGKARSTVFAPAKAAQRSLVQALARDLWPHGLHVSIMIVDGTISAEGAAAAKNMSPNDIASTALYLVQQPASAWTLELDIRPKLEEW